MEKFIKNITELLDTETCIEGKTLLADIEEWDSLSVVSFLAMADIKYDKLLKENAVMEAKCINDLYDLVSK